MADYTLCRYGCSSIDGCRGYCEQDAPGAIPRIPTTARRGHARGINPSPKKQPLGYRASQHHGH